MPRSSRTRAIVAPSRAAPKRVTSLTNWSSWTSSPLHSRAAGRDATTVTRSPGISLSRALGETCSPSRTIPTTRESDGNDASASGRPQNAGGERCETSNWRTWISPSAKKSACRVPGTPTSRATELAVSNSLETMNPRPSRRRAKSRGNPCRWRGSPCGPRTGAARASRSPDWPRRAQCRPAPAQRPAPPPPAAPRGPHRPPARHGHRRSPTPSSGAADRDRRPCSRAGRPSDSSAAVPTPPAPTTITRIAPVSRWRARLRSH